MHAITNRFIASLHRILEYSRWEYTYKKYREKYDINESFRFNGVGIILSGEGKIILGENSYIGNYSYIQSNQGCIVQIGRNCSISDYVMIYTENLIPNQNFKQSRETVKRSVTVGNYCWIGLGAFINQGITIGDNVVIGAHSVVSKDIPSFTIAMGAPIRIIKTIEGMKG
jgi:maltose O-acetyltransferase